MGEEWHGTDDGQGAGDAGVSCPRAGGSAEPAESPAGAGELCGDCGQRPAGIHHLPPGQPDGQAAQGRRCASVRADDLPGAPGGLEAHRCADDAHGPDPARADPPRPGPGGRAPGAARGCDPGADGRAVGAVLPGYDALPEPHARGRRYAPAAPALQRGVPGGGAGRPGGGGGRSGHRPADAHAALPGAPGGQGNPAADGGGRGAAESASGFRRADDCQLPPLPGAAGQPRCLPRRRPGRAPRGAGLPGEAPSGPDIAGGVRAGYARYDGGEALRGPAGGSQPGGAPGLCDESCRGDEGTVRSAGAGAAALQALGGRGGAGADGGSLRGHPGEGSAAVPPLRQLRAAA